MTLRGEEVDTLQECTNVDHIVESKWGPPLVDADWHPFCKSSYEGIGRKEWEELCCHDSEMSKATPMVLNELVNFGPCVSAETVKACALIGLHMVTLDNALRSDSDSSPDLGDMWSQKVLCGAATALNGQEVRVLLLWCITSTTSVISLLKSLGRIGQVK